MFSCELCRCDKLLVHKIKVKYLDYFEVGIIWVLNWHLEMALFRFLVCNGTGVVVLCGVFPMSGACMYLSCL